MYHLGTSGWYYDHWIGNFYPENIKKGDWLQFYAEKISTVEVNASFYRLPFKNMVKGWRNKAPEDFIFTFKGSRVVTHRKKLQDVSDYLERFYQRIDLIEDKKGAVLWQLPPQLKRDDELLENFLTNLHTDEPQVVEFRHKTWFDKEVYRLLEKYDVGYCIVSCPDLPVHMEVTSDFAYIRWHGKKQWYQTNYSDKELEYWAEIIDGLDVEDVYGYFNNDFQGYAPQNCLTLKKIIGED